MVDNSEKVPRQFISIMSRSPHLPPRSPFQSRSLPRRSFDGAPQAPLNDPHRSPSHTPLLDEQPLWLDDLLTDRETRPSGMSLHRSSSDPVVLRGVATSLHGPISPVYEEDALSDYLFNDSAEADRAGEICHGFETGRCIYGPNSPRQKGKLTDSESSMMAALLENVHSTELQYFMDYPSTSATKQPRGREDDYTPSASTDFERFSRMRAGQRSRVRKVQHIAELERQVEILHNVGAHLAAEVAAMFQSRLTLSLENKTLRRRIVSLRLEKSAKDGQHQSLKKEADRLRSRHQRSKSAVSCIDIGLSAIDPAQADWQMQNLGKHGRGGS